MSVSLSVGESVRFTAQVVRRPLAFSSRFLTVHIPQVHHAGCLFCDAGEEKCFVCDRETMSCHAEGTRSHVLALWSPLNDPLTVVEQDVSRFQLDLPRPLSSLREYVATMKNEVYSALDSNSFHYVQHVIDVLKNHSVASTVSHVRSMQALDMDLEEHQMNNSMVLLKRFKNGANALSVYLKASMLGTARRINIVVWVNPETNPLQLLIDLCKQYNLNDAAIENFLKTDFDVEFLDRSLYHLAKDETFLKSIDANVTARFRRYFRLFLGNEDDWIHVVASRALEAWIGDLPFVGPYLRFLIRSRKLDIFANSDAVPAESDPLLVYLGLHLCVYVFYC